MKRTLKNIGRADRKQLLASGLREREEAPAEEMEIGPCWRGHSSFSQWTAEKLLWHCTGRVCWNLPFEVPRRAAHREMPFLGIHWKTKWGAWGKPSTGRRLTVFTADYYAAAEGKPFTGALSLEMLLKTQLREAAGRGCCQQLCIAIYQVQELAWKGCKHCRGQRYFCCRTAKAGLSWGDRWLPEIAGTRCHRHCPHCGSLRAPVLQALWSSPWQAGGFAGATQCALWKQEASASLPAMFF